MINFTETLNAKNFPVSDEIRATHAGITDQIQQLDAQLDILSPYEAPKDDGQLSDFGFVCADQGVATLGTYRVFRAAKDAENGPDYLSISYTEFDPNHPNSEAAKAFFQQGVDGTDDGTEWGEFCRRITGTDTKNPPFPRKVHEHEMNFHMDREQGIFRVDYRQRSFDGKPITQRVVELRSKDGKVFMGLRDQARLSAYDIPSLRMMSSGPVSPISNSDLDVVTQELGALQQALSARFPNNE